MRSGPESGAAVILEDAHRPAFREGDVDVLGSGIEDAEQRASPDRMRALTPLLGKAVVAERFELQERIRHIGEHAR